MNKSTKTHLCYSAVLFLFYVLYFRDPLVGGMLCISIIYGRLTCLTSLAFNRNDFAAANPLAWPRALQVEFGVILGIVGAVSGLFYALLGDSRMGPLSWPELASGLVVAAVSIALGFKKISKEMTKDSAETSIVSLLRSEVERMANVNLKISSELTSVQTQLLESNRRLTETMIENNKLKLQTQIVTSSNQ